MSNSIEPGTQLGPYEIKKLLGAGGMGEVWLARDARLGREVAIKVLPPEFAADPERLARFEQEARAAGALNHPHIAAVFDIGVSESGTSYMVQEYLAGGTLGDEIRDGAMKLERVVEVAAEVAEALGAAHAGGIVHRDIKPDNIFITTDRHTKVLDFGLAKLTQAGLTSGEASMSPTMIGTMAGAVMGTVGYMAPEQVEAGTIDGRTDIFALGCVLYEMAGGRRPFEGENVHTTLGLILSADPKPVQSLRSAVPTQLAWIIDKCLTKRPERRYQHADDLAVDLRLLLRSLENGSTDVPQTPDLPTDTPVAGVPAALVAALVLIGAGLTWGATWWTRPQPVVPPVRTFDWVLPAEAPQALPCCGSQVSIARDGSFVVFAARDAQNETGLYVRRMDSGQVHRLGDIEGRMPTISPDGQWVAYIDDQKLMKIALTGEAPFEIGGTGGWPQWADDGFIYIGGETVRRIPENGGEPETLEVPGLPEGLKGFRAHALPGGAGLLVELAGETPLQGEGIWAFDPASGVSHQLLAEGRDPRYSPSGHVLWTRAGTVYAAAFDLETLSLRGPVVPVIQGLMSDFLGSGQFGVADDGTVVWIVGDAIDLFSARWSLAWLGSDGEIEIAATDIVSGNAARLAPDGTRIATMLMAADNDTFEANLWILDSATEALTQLTFEGGANLAWSPDGDWIYFSALDGLETTGISRVATDFSGVIEPVYDAPGQPEAVSPDGEWLLFGNSVGEGEDSHLDLWRLPLAPPGEAESFVEAPGSQRQARFSPDGAYVAYTSSESGQSQVYVRETAGSRRWTAGLGSSPVWALDGSALYYRGPADGDAASIRVMSVARAGSGGLTLGPARDVVSLPGRLAGPVAIGDDGRFLMLDRRDQSGANSSEADRINAKLNWFQELERLAPRDH